MPGARFGAGGRALNGKLYVVGGNGGQGSVATTFVYDPATDRWSTHQAWGFVHRRVSLRGGRSDQRQRARGRGALYPLALAERGAKSAGEHLKNDGAAH